MSKASVGGSVARLGPLDSGLEGEGRCRACALHWIEERSVRVERCVSWFFHVGSPLMRPGRYSLHIYILACLVPLQAPVESLQLSLESLVISLALAARGEARNIGLGRGNVHNTNDGSEGERGSCSRNLLHDLAVLGNNLDRGLTRNGARNGRLGGDHVEE